MFRTGSVEGGGNAASMAKPDGQPLIVRRTAAIGDALAASTVSDKLAEQGFFIEFQTHPNIHCVLRRQPRVHKVSSPNGFCHVNLDGAYENDPNRRTRHFHEMFFARANMQLLARGIVLGEPLNCRPRMSVPNSIRQLVIERFITHPRPWVFICPRSNAYNVRQVPDWIWEKAASAIEGTKFWLGTHPAPPNIVDLQCNHFDNVIEWLSSADLLITVDTGPMHVAAAMGVPVLALGQSSSPELHLNDQNDFECLWPANLTCLNCQKNLCPKSRHAPPCQLFEPEAISRAANRKLSGMKGSISAIVPIYQPEVGTLNRCLQQVVTQVDEVIVTAEGNSRLPNGAMQHPKIRYVRTPKTRIGYGRNVNFGVRHSCGKYLLLLNDDVFLEPNAVARLKEEIVDNVGLAAHLLRYADGTIYHAGKVRSPGVRGWGHIDLRKKDPTIKEPRDMENVCGASVLVRREAFYSIGGFDEEFFIYAEDDDFMLRLRRDGWRIRYTPRASGIHLEHQSTSKLGAITDVVNKANKLFDKKWHRYFDHNHNRVPGNFEY